MSLRVSTDFPPDPEGDDTALRRPVMVGRGSSAWQKSITYKLATYWEGWKASRHVEQFGLKQMRVLMLTSSEERMKHMLGVVNELTQGKGSAFLFGHAPQLNDIDPLNVAWTSGRGQAVRLTD